MGTYIWIFILELSVKLHFTISFESLNIPVNSTCLKNLSFVHGYGGKINIYKRINDASLFSCMSECKASKLCKSFNFDAVSFTCELSSHGPELKSDLIKESDTIYSHSVLFSRMQNLEGPCADTRCPADTSCTVNRLGQALCIEEYGDCGPPFPRDNANVLITGTSAGSRLHMTCKKDYFHCGKSNTATCTTRGLWEGMVGKCVNGTIETKKSQVRYQLPCSMDEGKLLQVKMKRNGLKHKWFLIYLLQNNYIVIKINCRRKRKLTECCYINKKAFKPSKVEQDDHITVSIYRGKSSFEVTVGSDTMSLPVSKAPKTASEVKIHTKFPFQIKMSARFG